MISHIKMKDPNSFGCTCMVSNMTDLKIIPILRIVADTMPITNEALMAAFHFASF